MFFLPIKNGTLPADPIAVSCNRAPWKNTQVFSGSVEWVRSLEISLFSWGLPLSHFYRGRALCDLVATAAHHVNKDPRFKDGVRNCFGNSFFFRFFFFGGVRGERQVRAGFSGHLGVVLGLSRLRSGETSGEMQVPSRFGHKKLLQKANCPVHFCFLCIYLCWCVCVCVCDRVCSMCFLSVVVLIFHSMHFFSCICNLSI